jgi:predicted nucleic acid-binding protein
MEKALKVLVDTDILIKAFRGDDDKIRNLSLLKDRYCISVITSMELFAGAKNIKQLSSYIKLLKIYQVIQIDENISQKAFQLFKTYILKNPVASSDCFIAATALHYGFELYTDNKKDYNFIKGINFYIEK